MRAIVLFSLVIVGACASGGSDPRATATSTQSLIGGATLQRAEAVPEYVTPIDASVEPVWSALPVVYDSLGIPLTIVDFKAHLLGNQGLKVQHTLGKVPLSKYIECGNGQVISSADTYDIFLTVVSYVRANGHGGSDLVTTMTAAAKPLIVAQEYFPCATRGELEKKIADIVKAMVGR